MEPELERAAAAIAAADSLLIAAGAGMGVDSGLPDFRGDDGFWRAYPPLARLGLSFVDMAQPRWFRRDPALAWGFYGHRLHLYRESAPHAGYEILRRWAARRPSGAFVVTSNVDGHFVAAGFDPARVAECHGSLAWLQCVAGCGQPLWSADGVSVQVDPQTLRAEAPLPSCPACGGIARPNVLLFDDFAWDPTRADAQWERLSAWVDGLDLARMVVLECGAGRALPTIRRFSEQLAGYGATLVRINPREPQAPRGAVSLPLGARDALERLASRCG